MSGRNSTDIYFKLITFFLYSLAAFPKEKVLSGKVKTFMLNKVWPAVFFLIWTPLVPMMSLKIHQFINNKMWDDLLEIMHMFILACNSLYYAGALQKAAKHYKTTMDLVNNHFKSPLLHFQREFWMITLGLSIAVCFLMCFTANLYYRENLIPLWIPLLDNEKPLPIGAFIFVWVYEGVAGCYLVIIYAIVAPFVVVMTTIIDNEMSCMIRRLERFRYFSGQASNWKDRNNNHHYIFNTSFGLEDVVNVNCPSQEEVLSTECFSEFDTKHFIRSFVLQHYHILRTIDEVGKIHKYIFFSQAFFTITHSCFLAFSFYYTHHLAKVVFKYSPILAVSYFLLYLYCWNGQRLTDTCKELQTSLYRCRWIGAPKSFRSSLLIIIEYSKQPVLLTGGGVFSASLHTFLKGIQQSVSYILILKAMTPERSIS